MQNETKLKFIFGSVCVMLLCSFISLSKIASANLIDRQSFRPIEWESDFVSAHSLSFSGMILLNGAQIVRSEEQKLKSAFGLQLCQSLRDQWTGRVGLFVGRTGPAPGQYVWTLLGSDLQHSLIPEKLYDFSFFKYVRPNGFFGLGVTSRWENTGLGLNLIPTLRYNVSEPVAQFGLQLLSPLADELIFEIEYRFLQSARVSQNRGSTIALSLIWGRISKK